jgi:predicted RNase H-like HicB family nuclease
MKKIKYVIYKEGKYFVSQCLNVDVSSFGVTIDEASANLKEALQLYFEDGKDHWDYQPISEALIGETQMNLK